ncbi:hypothetical protein BB559_006576 [Furculomyces boomerangus]|uniref:Ribokinase n=2 Tax=Harpellales TaxID=61421 RepID=A0A2T9Y1S8_9FUNG|nr:hypothetical protein BB559_006576 [Furculomyces boomerangus]PVZ98803.1 hypothetical protein BB558_005189 [Smittium angustum]PVZ99366.1 hypothetical protein BB558_004616 [Smittium angustum]
MSVIVFGSINIDEVYTVPHIVRPGETITSTKRVEVAGGKGANSCVSAARSGANTFMYANVGSDGKWVKDIIGESGANTKNILELQDETTGRAIIQVNEEGENSIFLYPGANHKHVLKNVLDSMQTNGVRKGDYMVLANETNSVYEIIQEAKSRLGVTVVWNPAPMPTKHTPELANALGYVDVLVVNETEICDLIKLASTEYPETVISTAESTGDYSALVEMISDTYGTKIVVVTKGSKGVEASINYGTKKSDTESRAIISMAIAPVPQDRVVDTTAAGDTWIGYFVSGLSSSNLVEFFSGGECNQADVKSSVEKAMGRANYASGITVTRHGAIPSIPTKQEVDNFVATNKV